MTREVALSDLLQKFMLTKLALEASNNKGTNIESNDDFNHILYEVGNYLTSDEQSALLYIKYLSMSNRVTIEVASLRERVYRANETAMYGRC